MLVIRNIIVHFLNRTLSLKNIMHFVCHSYRVAQDFDCIFNIAELNWCSQKTYSNIQLFLLRSMNFHVNATVKT